MTRVDPATDRVLGAPVTVGDETAAIAAGDDAAWVLARRDGPDTPKIDWFVVRVDPAGGATRVVARVLGYDPNELAVERGTLWVTEASRHALDRFDARTRRALGAPIHTGPEPWGLAVGGRSAWVGDRKRGTTRAADASRAAWTASPTATPALSKRTARAAGVFAVDRVYRGQVRTPPCGNSSAARPRLPRCCRACCGAGTPRETRASRATPEPLGRFGLGRGCACFGRAPQQQERDHCARQADAGTSQEGDVEAVAQRGRRLYT